MTIAATSPHALAEAPDPTATGSANQGEIDRLYEAGKVALTTDAVLALRHFKSALHLAEGQSDQAWPLLLAIALAYKDSGAPAYAAEYFRRFLAYTDAHQDQLSIKWKQRRDRVMAVLTEFETALKASHGFLSVTSIPAGAKLTVDGKPAGADRNAVTPFDLTLTPGDHMVGLSLDGHAAVQRVVTVAAGATQTLPIALQAAVETTPAGPVGTGEASTTVSASTSGAPESSVLPWVTMGVGGGVGLIGAVFSVLAAGESSELDTIRAVGGDPGSAQGHVYADKWSEHASAVETYQLVAGILYGLAAASVATGVVLLVLEPSEAPQAASVLPTIDLTPTRGGLTGHATWRF